MKHRNKFWSTVIFGWIFWSIGAKAEGYKANQCVPRFNLSAELKTNKQTRSDRKKAAFIEFFAPLALEIQETCKIPARVALAQSALETGWGTSGGFRNHKNAFGIGTSRRYPTVFASAKAYCYYLTESKGTRRSYRDIRNAIKKAPYSLPKEGDIIRGLGNYATNPNYRAIIRSFVKKLPADLATKHLCDPGPASDLTLANYTVSGSKEKALQHIFHTVPIVRQEMRSWDGENNRSIEQ